MIDYREAQSIGLQVEYLPLDSDLWQKLRLLTCMYEYYCRKDGYLKIFEGAVRSAAIEVPLPAQPTVG